MVQRRESVEVVRFDGVGFRYPGGSRVFKDLSFCLYAGSFSFLTGPSGIGKTSILKLMYRDITTSEGVVRVFGRNAAKLSDREVPLFRQKMGLVFQDCRLINQISVMENVALVMKINGTSERSATQHAIELLEWVGLQDHIHEMPQNLSDGQKQRVAIARAVITRPLLLLADEPTGNVDDHTAMRLMYLFEELNKIGTTIIIATHNRSLVSEFGYPELQLDHYGISLNQNPHASMPYGNVA